MDELLTGRRIDADTALMLAVQNAMLPDPYDGVPADVTADPVHGGKGGTMGDAAAAVLDTGRADRDRIIDRAFLSGRRLGVLDVHGWLIANGYPAAAQAVMLNSEAIKDKIQADHARGC